MTRLVYDASIVLNWLFDDERDPRAVAAAEALGETAGVVPLMWQYEMRNVVLVIGRKQRVAPEITAGRLRDIVLLPFETDHEADAAAAFALALRHDLTFYDALYLELARRRDAPLATLDRALAAAARAEGLLWA